MYILLIRFSVGHAKGNPDHIIHVTCELVSYINIHVQYTCSVKPNWWPDPYMMVMFVQMDHSCTCHVWVTPDRGVYVMAKVIMYQTTVIMSPWSPLRVITGYDLFRDTGIGHRGQIATWTNTVLRYRLTIQRHPPWFNVIFTLIRVSSVMGYMYRDMA